MKEFEKIFERRYDKLVRDKIPQIMEESGCEYEIEKVDDATALEYLYSKLIEELYELLRDKNIEEVIDVLEVVLTIGKSYGYDEETIMELRKLKLEEKGGFEENIILKKVYK